MTSGMTLLEAISSADGLTDFANAKEDLCSAKPGKRREVEDSQIHYKDALKGDGNFNILLATRRYDRRSVSGEDETDCIDCF